VLGKLLGKAAIVAVAASSLVPVAGPDVAEAFGCSLAPTHGTVIRFLGRRTYRLRVPSGLSGSVPLLISMHGAGWTSKNQESVTGWNGYASTYKFVVAYPQGLGNSWSISQGSYDVTFLREVADDIADRYCINRRRVYAEGQSNGGFMAERLACDAAHTFAAVAGYAAGSTTPCQPSRPIGVALFHGELDNTIPPTLGRTSRDEWVARNGCTAGAYEPVPDGTQVRYTGCRGDVQVLWRSYAGQGHARPTGARGADLRAREWSFLTAHMLP
jgi:polyhydroxybutyrate depolymerase